MEEYCNVIHNTGYNIILHGKLQGYRHVLRIVIPIVFPQQQLLHQRASVLLDMYIFLLIFNVNVFITSKIVNVLKSFQNKMPVIRQP